jgi:hypothetical protein
MPGEASASLALPLKERGIPVVMISGSPEAVKFAEDNGLQISAKTFSLARALQCRRHSARQRVSSDSDYKVVANAKKKRAGATMSSWYVSYRAGAGTVMSLYRPD